jgi:hypothetical protein
MKPGTLILEARKALEGARAAHVQPVMWIMNEKAWDHYVRSSLQMERCDVGRSYPTMLDIEVKLVCTSKLLHFNGFKTEIILITAEE